MKSPQFQFKEMDEDPILGSKTYAIYPKGDFWVHNDQNTELCSIHNLKHLTSFLEFYFTRDLKQFKKKVEYFVINDWENDLKDVAILPEKLAQKELEERAIAFYQLEVVTAFCLFDLVLTLSSGQ